MSRFLWISRIASTLLLAFLGFRVLSFDESIHSSKLFGSFLIGFILTASLIWLPKRWASNFFFALINKKGGFASPIRFLPDTFLLQNYKSEDTILHILFLHFLGWMILFGLLFFSFLY